MALAATLAVPLSLFSQWLSFFVSTLEALNFQPEGLANPSAEGWWPQRGDVSWPYGVAEGQISGGRRSREGGGSARVRARLCRGLLIYLFFLSFLLFFSG